MKRSMKESYSKVAIEAITDKSQHAALLPTASVTIGTGMGDVMRKTATTITKPSKSLVPAQHPLGSQVSGLNSKALRELRVLAVAQAKKEGIPTTAIHQGIEGWNKAKILAYLEHSTNADTQTVEVDQIHEVDVDSIADVLPAADGDQATAEDMGEYVDIRLHIQKMKPSLGLKAIMISFDVGV